MGTNSPNTSKSSHTIDSYFLPPAKKGSESPGAICISDEGVISLRDFFKTIQESRLILNENEEMHRTKTLSLLNKNLELHASSNPELEQFSDFIQKSDSMSQSICLKFLRTLFDKGSFSIENLESCIKNFTIGLVPRLLPKEPSELEMDRQVLGLPAIKVNQSVALRQLIPNRLKSTIPDITILRKQIAGNGIATYSFKKDKKTYSSSKLSELAQVYPSLENFEHTRMEPLLERELSYPKNM
ncbi:hypothetical protein DSO57_1016845 [Entomophthora muscae]|uniref:Uncharacterized protein n=1 Tax=Entomophthora muscae TaxID=34485 RepID=A0ACC2RJC0_9FUNG|nr:hypothetical protein DSO57_1016845 [Entomophthora muscae]